ncbi:hypothetical protein, partial [Thalassovita autumnalis]|uniref:hypothetical protein n=1 Tax=Thalassovita autumnalis TaxID=2072972 RepID=UPI00071C90B4
TSSRHSITPSERGHRTDTKEQKHLDIQNGLFKEVLPLVAKASKYWRVLDDEHRDFLNAVRFAIEEGKRWE